ncbi:SpoIIE family protein phosphatase, partial [Streptomyces sp. NPDC056982]|uniref:SpoIIE family protein phosphatase n=1 Tax=Streptomyces sp. NPDC056982 TaxID=3345986 RepID=UPI003635357B
DRTLASSRLRCSRTRQKNTIRALSRARDTLILYTDGVTEARDEGGVFYPFAQRVEQWTTSSPEALLDHIRRDLLAHCRGHLSDDAAIIAVQRNPVPRPGAAGR